MAANVLAFSRQMSVLSASSSSDYSGKAYMKIGFITCTCKLYLRKIPINKHKFLMFKFDQISLGLIPRSQTLGSIQRLTVELDNMQATRTFFLMACHLVFFFTRSSYFKFVQWRLAASVISLPRLDDSLPICPDQSRRLLHAYRIYTNQSSNPIEDPLSCSK